MRRRPVFLLALIGAGAAFLRRRRAAGRTEKNLWTEATTPPDLR
ncbi:MAG: DLW-39 family protein [Actinomycetota bacterium]|nr:DLW-39 family protein [Actinomycetota bacterium]